MNVTYQETPNGLNQLQSRNGAQLTYDQRGNLINDGSWAMTYDSENRLLTTPYTTLGYDPLGRLASTTYSSLRLQYDADRLLIERGYWSGSVERRYVHGPAADEPLVWYEGSQTTSPRYLHADERGSIVAVSDSAGNALAANCFDEYGVPQGTLTVRFGHTGQAWLPQLGLYYYRARMYHPQLGRFMQPDPIGYGSGMNMYAYVGGDPVTANANFGGHIANIGPLSGGRSANVGISTVEDASPDYWVDVAHHRCRRAERRDGVGGIGDPGAPPVHGGMLQLWVPALAPLLISENDVLAGAAFRPGSLRKVRFPVDAPIGRQLRALSGARRGFDSGERPQPGAFAERRCGGSRRPRQGQPVGADTFAHTAEGLDDKVESTMFSRLPRWYRTSVKAWLVIGIPLWVWIIYLAFAMEGEWDSNGWSTVSPLSGDSAGENAIGAIASVVSLVLVFFPIVALPFALLRSKRQR